MVGENVIKKTHCTTATGPGDLSDSEGANTNIVILNYRLQFKGSRTQPWGSEAPDKCAKAPPGGKRACSVAVPMNLTVSPSNKQYKIRMESFHTKEKRNKTTTD